MKDPSNPAHVEIRIWAYSEELWPEEDWDIIIIDFANAPVILELASDPDCPSRSIHLSCLYHLVGNHFRSKPDFSKQASRKSFQPLRQFLNSFESGSDPLIESWLRQSKELLENPRMIHYDGWCDGGLARKEMLKYGKSE